MTLTIMTFGIITTSMKGLFVTLSIEDTQYQWWSEFKTLSITKLSLAECRVLFWISLCRVPLCWMTVCRVSWAPFLEVPVSVFHQSYPQMIDLGGSYKHPRLSQYDLKKFYSTGPWTNIRLKSNQSFQSIKFQKKKLEKKFCWNDSK